MKRIIMLLIIVSVLGCSLKPQRLVTREDLAKFQIYRRFIIKESPEQVLDALNEHGEVILRAKRNIPGRNLPVHVKILATSSGLEVMDYDR